MPQNAEFESTVSSPPKAGNSQSSQLRTSRLHSAWLSLVPSKVITLFVQILAIPVVYRTLEPAQFASFVAITSAASVLNFLNLGMGGALVTPLTQAAAAGNHNREATLLSSTLVPLVCVSGLSLCVMLPLLWILPLEMLLGHAGTATPPSALRTAVLLACAGTILTIPLSVVDSLRQAYQEMHVSNSFGALSNGALCVGYLLAAWKAPTLPGFVGAVVGIPLAVRLLNALFLLVRRPYLMAVAPLTLSWPLVRRLAGDGLSYMGAAALASVLVYQWPIYYIARVRSSAESSTFAVYLQLTVLVLSFGISVAQPLWAAIADAIARQEYTWINRTISYARLAAVAYGVVVLIVFGLTMNFMLRLWLRRPVSVATENCWLAGTYVLLAMWEYIHWPLALVWVSLELPLISFY